MNFYLIKLRDIFFSLLILMNIFILPSFAYNIDDYRSGEQKIISSYEQYVGTFMGNGYNRFHLIATPVGGNTYRVDRIIREWQPCRNNSCTKRGNPQLKETNLRKVPYVDENGKNLTFGPYYVKLGGNITLEWIPCRTAWEYDSYLKQTVQRCEKNTNQWAYGIFVSNW